MFFMLYFFYVFDVEQFFLPYCTILDGRFFLSLFVLRACRQELFIKQKSQEKKQTSA